MAKVYENLVIHDRILPRPYKFNFRFFWFYFDLNELEQLSSKTNFFSYNRFNLFSFYDRDHFGLGRNVSLRDRIISYLKEHEVDAQIKSIKILTNLRFLGYVFNPVSYFFIEMESGKSHAIIEICNTYHEVKPYFVHSDHFDGKKFEILVDKFFYISPFSSLENKMKFQFSLPQKTVNINIFDYLKTGELEIKTHLRGNAVGFSSRQLLKCAFFKPFATVQVTLAIHWHALKIYLKKIPYFKKKSDQHLQKGFHVWK